MLRKHWLGACAAAAGLLYLAWTARYSVLSDEVEHLHAAYLISQGLLPFRDFWEHHSPLLWVVLAPFMRLLPETGGILITARAVCFLFSGALLYLVWAVSKRLWGRQAHFGVTALFFFSGAAYAQYSAMRPDPFMLFFVFSSFYLLLRALQEEGDRLFFYSGFCMSLAFWLSPKWITTLLALPLALFFCRPSLKRWFSANLLYGVGFALGAVPLAAYIFGNGISQEFYRWVFKFNAKPIFFQTYIQPTFIALFAAGMAGAWAAWRTIGSVRPLWLALWAVVLFNTLFIYRIDYQHSYYGASFFLFACTLSSGFFMWMGQWRNLLLKAVLWAAFLAAAILPSAHRILEHETQFAPFGRQIGLIDWLAENFKGETVTMSHPWHPIYAKDAGILQMVHFFQRQGNKRVDRTGFVDHLRTRRKWTEEIIDSRPSVIAKWEVERILPELTKHRLISREDYERFIRFLKSEYIPVTKDGATFLLRRGHPAARTADKVGEFTK